MTSILTDSQTQMPAQIESSLSTQPLYDMSFIETQFPVSKLSKESYAERRANQSQTITGLGKWWGRKPLVLCRATILGLLLPSTSDPNADRDVFLRLMTMDDDGMLRRKSVNIPANELYKRLPLAERELYFDKQSTENNARWKRGVSRETKAQLQQRVFLSLSYDQKLEYCDRPEQIEGPSSKSWDEINKHLGTTATTLPELVIELGKRRFGHIPKIGDSFCGGGSIPFEAARLGCEAYGSDLNPVASLLSWASLNIIGAGEKAIAVNGDQRAVYDLVDHQITEWGIEHREPDAVTGRRWRADTYLYCTETVCPECHWRVPVASSWLIGPTSKVIAVLHPDNLNRCFEIQIRQQASEEEMRNASKGSMVEADLICPHCKEVTPIRAIRGDGRGTFGETKSLLREWINDDVRPRDDDIFTERLYCIRWVDTWEEVTETGEERTFSKRIFAEPTEDDIQRELTVQKLLSERFHSWQKAGFIPSRRIDSGYNNSQPMRERGWTYWHHFFNPRQLLINGLFLEKARSVDHGERSKVAALLGIGRCADWNSRLCRWGTGAARESIAQTFSNQALNTLFNYASKGLSLLDGSWFPNSPVIQLQGDSKIAVQDARDVPVGCDIWITDPPYADAINYHEVSEFFLAWYSSGLKECFPEWSSDSRRALAVRADDNSFRESMVAIYKQLAAKMPDNGLQVVMFTHQDVSVWADLVLILWGAGLRVSAAWCIQTERQASGTRDGNYVQGTVLLVLRKQLSGGSAFLDEIYQQVEAEVREQLDVMRDMDDLKDPNFTDTDYQLAAYAAALRVLTSKRIEEIDIGYELTRTRKRGEISLIEDLILQAVHIACDHLIPRGVQSHTWKSLSSFERFYLKGLELESHGEHRTGAYQELARGFGVEEYRLFLASTRANETRLKNASEFGRREIGNSGFGISLVRHALFATYKTAETETPREGISWLLTEVTNYSSNRQRLIELLEFFAALRQNASISHWHRDADAAALLAGALRNRQDNV